MATSPLLKSDWESGRLVYRRRDTGAGILAINPSCITQFMAVTALTEDDDTLTGDAIAGGIITYNGPCCGGDLTFDTAENILAAFPGLQVGEAVEFYIQNIGTTTATLANDDPCDPTVTILDTAQTIAANESAKVILHYSAEGAFDAYTIGA